MYHSLYFFEESLVVPDDTTSLIYAPLKNTWTDWHLYPKQRPAVAAPAQKTSTIDIMGSNGYIDLSDYLTGEPLYNNRTGSWSFMVDNDHPETWATIYGDICSYLHGKRMCVMLEDDPMWFYTGRFTVSDWNSLPQKNGNSEVSISYVLEPFKRRRDVTSSDWLWDAFDFESGVVIPLYDEQTISGAELYSMFIENNNDEPLRPHLTVDIEQGLLDDYGLRVTVYGDDNIQVDAETIIKSSGYLDDRFLVRKGKNRKFEFSLYPSSGVTATFNVSCRYGSL